MTRIISVIILIVGIFPLANCKKKSFVFKQDTNLHEIPNGKPIEKLSVGTEIEILDNKEVTEDPLNLWWKVKVNDKTGYIFSSNISKDEKLLSSIQNCKKEGMEWFGERCVKPWMVSFLGKKYQVREGCTSHHWIQPDGNVAQYDNHCDGSFGQPPSSEKSIGKWKLDGDKILVEVSMAEFGLQFLWCYQVPPDCPNPANCYSCLGDWVSKRIQTYYIHESGKSFKVTDTEGKPILMNTTNCCL